jgi:hypothetical protein
MLLPSKMLLRRNLKWLAAYPFWGVTIYQFGGFMAQAYRRVAILESSVSGLRASVVLPFKLLVFGKLDILQVRKMI